MSTLERDYRSTVERFWTRYGPAQYQGVPKHSALHAALSAAISDGFWPPGSKLPTEAELVACSGFSLGTVQRAMRTLAERGVVERRRRRGTYVANTRRQLDRPWHCRFLGDDGETFLPVFTTVVGRAVTEREGPWTGPLAQRGHSIVRIERHMEINSEFTVFSEFYARADRFPRFVETPADELAGTDLKALVIESVGAPLSAIHEQLRVIPFPRHICREIDVPDGTAGIHIQAVALASDPLPVYYQEFFVPPTERRLYVDSRMPLS